MIDNFKTVSDVWEEHSSSWKRAKNINKDVRSAYNATKNISMVLDSFKYDKFRINCRVKESDIDDLEMIRERLQNFTLKVHDDAEDIIDNIFNIEVMRLLEYLYSFNPGEITLSYGSKTNLASMIGVVTIDKDLRDSFLSKVNELDNDEMSNDLKSIFADSIRRYYDDGAYVDGMIGQSTQFTRDRDLLIEYYETLNPEDKKNMDKLFDGMIKDGNFDSDISNLKFIAYTAEEPYKSVFFKYLPDMKIGKYDLPDDDSVGESYDPYINRLELDFNNTDGTIPDITGLNNPRGPYVTFFHECGHAIDDLAKTDWAVKVNRQSTSFEYDGKSFYDVIEEDVQKLISEVAEDCIRKDSNFRGMTEKDIKDYSNVVTDQIMKAGEDYSMLDSNLQAIYYKIKKEIGYYPQNSNVYNIGNTYDFSSDKHCGFSDILGGMTDNSLSGMYGHFKKNYWFNIFDKPTHKQEREAYAHLFSYGMTGCPELQGVTDEYLPLSSEFFEFMMEDLVNE